MNIIRLNSIGDSGFGGSSVTKYSYPSKTEPVVTSEANAEFYFGILNSLTINCVSANEGDEFSVYWESGKTATTLTVTGLKVCEDFVPEAKYICEAHAKFHNNVWVVVFYQVSGE